MLWWGGEQRRAGERSKLIASSRFTFHFFGPGGQRVAAGNSYFDYGGLFCVAEVDPLTKSTFCQPGIRNQTRQTDPRHPQWDHHWNPRSWTRLCVNCENKINVAMVLKERAARLERKRKTTTRMQTTKRPRLDFHSVLCAALKNPGDKSRCSDEIV